MSKVENRVVRMTFDNAQFEKNIKNTMNTLTDFEKKLKLDGAAAGFNKLKSATDKLNLSAIGDKANKEVSRIGNATSEIFKSITSIGKASDSVDLSGLGNAAQDATYDVNNAVSNVDFSPITEGVNDAANSFNVLETVATGALLGLGNQIQNAGLNLAKKVKDMFLDPVKDGFKEYETQMGSIQTIMANTGMNFDSDDDIGAVNEKLDELNTYADKTIYNFTEMTKNIGTFTAAGVDLETATKSIQGIANLAALSGSNSQQASTAMYQLSQALAAGSLKLQDWNSVVNAGMGGKVFQEALKTTARVHGVAVDEIIADAGSFRESLSQEWISSEILTETLNHMAISYKEASMADEDYKKAFEDLVSQGYEEEQAKEILKLAKAAEQSATQVRTWSQLWDTVKEAIGSNWSQIWRNLIGDFKQATDTFTFLSQQISGGIDAMLGGIVHASEMFNKSGAIEIIFGGFVRNEDGSKVYDELTGEAIRIKGAIDFLFEAVAKPLGAIRDAFETIFFIDDDTLGIAMVKIAMEFTNFAKSLVISDDAATAIRNVFEGLFSVVKMGITIVSDAVGIFFSLVDVLRTFLAPILDIVLTIFGQVGRIVMWVVDRVLEIRDAFVYLLEPIGDVIDFVKNLVTALFGFIDIPGKITGVNNIFLEILSTLWKFIDIPGKIRFIGDALRAVFGFIGDLTGWNKAVAETDQIFQQTGESVSVFDVWIKNLLKNPVIAFFKGIFDAVSGLLTPLRDLYDSIFNVTELGEEGEEAVVVLGEAKSSILDILSPLGEMVKLIVGGLGLGIGVIFNLISGFVEFGKKIGDAVLAFEPVKNIIDGLISFKDNVVKAFTSIPDQFSKVYTDSQGPLHTIVSLVEGVFLKLQGVADYFSNVTLEQFIEDVRNKINDIIGVVKGSINYIFNAPLDKKIRDFASGFFEAFENLRSPLTSVTSWIESFFPGLNGSLTNGLNSNMNIIEGKLHGLFNYLQSVAKQTDSIPEFVLTILDDVKNTIVSKFDEIGNWIANFDISTFIRQMFDNVKKFIRDSFEPFLTNIAKTLESWFPALGDSLSSNVPGFINTLIGWTDRIQIVVENVTTVVGGLFENLKKTIDNVAPGLFDSLSNSFKGVIDFFIGIGDAIKTAKDNSNSIPEFFGNLFEIAKENIGKKLSEIRESIANFDLQSGVMTLLDNVKNALLNGVTFITGILSGLPGIFGTFFGGIHDFFENLKSEVKIDSGEIPNQISQMADGIKTGAEGVSEGMQGVWKGFDIKTIPDFIGNLIKNFKDYWSEKLKEFFDFIHTIPDRFLEFVQYLKKIIDTGIFDSIIGVIQKVLILGLVKSISDMLAGFGKLSKAAAGYLKSKSKQNTVEAFKDIAISIGIIAGTVALLSIIPDPMKGVLALAGTMGVLVVMQLISSFLSKHFSKGASYLLQSSASVAVFAGGLLILMYAIEKLTNFDFEANKKGLIAAAGCLAVLGLISIVISRFAGNGGSNFLSVSAGIVVMAAGLLVLVPALEGLTNVVQRLKEGDTLKMGGLLLAVGIFMILVGKAIANIGDSHPIASAVGIMLIAVAIGMIADAVNKIVKEDMGPIALASGILLGFLGVIYKITKDVKASTLFASSLALIAFGGAITVIGMSIDTLAKNDWTSLAAAGAALGALLLALYEMTKNLKAGDLVSTSGALIVFGLSIGIITASLYTLTTVDTAAMLLSAVALGALFGVFAALAKFTNGIDLGATAASLLIFGAAVAELSLSLMALTMFDPGLVWSSVGAFAALIAVFWAFSTLTLGADLLATGAALLEFGATLTMIAGAIWILVDAFNNFPSEEKMYDVGRALTAGLGKGIIDGFQDVFDAIVNLFKHIIDTFLGLFGIHSPSKVMEEQVGQFIPEGIAQGILGGEGSTDNAIGGIFDGIKTKAGEFLAGLPEWFNTTALPFLQQTITNFTTWFQNEGWPMIQQKAAEAWDWIQNEGWPKVQEFFGNAANWFATEGWPMIQQKLKEFWDWLSTEGWPAFCDWVKNTAWPAIKNFFGGIGEWFKTDGWPMIKQAVKDFWHWLSTEAWPAFCDWVKNTLWPAIKDLAKKFWDWLWNTALPKLGEWLKSLPGKLRNWWENDGRKMVGDAIKGLMDKAAEIKDRIIEWAAGIPGHIGEGLGKIWDKIKEKGSEIASGIAKGLVEGITHFPESVAQFGSNVVDAIKHFFGINSPSKLMRDEVGVYLPQGIAEGLLKGIPDATKAMGVLGDSVMAAAQSSMGDLSQFGSINTPTISPVVDMSQFNSSMSQVKDFGNTSSITGTLELTSNKLNKGIKANQSGITALGDGIVEVGSGITEISGTLGSSYNSISGQLGNAEDAIVVLDDDVVSMGTSTAAATANSTDAILSAMNEEKATLNDISKKVGNLDSSFTHYTDYWIYMMDRELAGIDLTTGEIADMLKEGKLNVYIDSGELVGAIAEKMDQTLGYRQVGAQRGMY